MPDTDTGNTEFSSLAAGLVDAGRMLYARGMLAATSGNLSARLDDGTIAITVSCSHKGMFAGSNIMRLDADGCSLDARRPSVETGLHLQIFRRFLGAHAVLHPQSVNATLPSRRHDAHLVREDYELLKAFPGIDIHDCRVTVPNFANDTTRTSTGSPPGSMRGWLAIRRQTAT